MIFATTAKKIQSPQRKVNGLFIVPPFYCMFFHKARWP